MSKLQEKLEKVNKAASSAGSGFGFLATREKTPTMLLIGALSNTDARLASDCAKKGADLLLVSYTNGFDSAPQQLKETSAPWGAVLQNVTSETIEGLIAAASDFLTISNDSPASVLASEKIGRVLQIASDMSDSDLRTISALRLDALICDVPSPLKVAGVASVLRFALLTGKPVVVSIHRQDLSATELEVLRDAGAKGVIVEVKSKEDLNRLGAVRKLIDDLPVRSLRNEHARGTALISQPAMPQREETRRPPHEPDEDE